LHKEIGTEKQDIYNPNLFILLSDESEKFHKSQLCIHDSILFLWLQIIDNVFLYIVFLCLYFSIIL
jgi:hypothetical protein